MALGLKIGGAGEGIKGLFLEQCQGLRDPGFIPWDGFLIFPIMVMLLSIRDKSSRNQNRKFGPLEVRKIANSPPQKNCLQNFIVIC